MIQRYELEQTGHYDDEIDHEMFPNESGEWVRYEDVQPFLSEADQRDAARYRWLRKNSTKPVEPWSTHEGPESLDAIIDAAMFDARVAAMSAQSDTEESK